MIIKNMVKLVFTVSICGLTSLPFCCHAANSSDGKSVRASSSVAESDSTYDSDSETEYGDSENGAAAAAESDSTYDSGSETEYDDSEDGEVVEPETKKPRNSVEERVVLGKEDPRCENAPEDVVAAAAKSDSTGDSGSETEYGDSESESDEEVEYACRKLLELSGTPFATESPRPLSVQEFTLMQALTTVNNGLRLRPGCRRLEGKYAVVGDIHGDLITFNALISKLQADMDNNVITGVVFLGDLWDRVTGGAEIFDRLIRFMARNNTSEHPERVVVLRGNHETVSYMVSNAETEGCAQRILSYFGLEPCDFFALRRPSLRPDQFSQCAQYIDNLPKPLRDEVVNFYKLIPFNAIVNNDTYLAHGGMPLWPDKSDLCWKLDSEQVQCWKIGYGVFANLARQLISTDRDVYPQEVLVTPGVYNAVYSSVWSDFKEERGDGNLNFPFSINLSRGSVGYESCQFGIGALLAYSLTFRSYDKALDIKHYVFGHDHRKGAFSKCIIHYDELSCTCTCTTVISSPMMTFTSEGIALNEGAVALVEPNNEPRKYIEIIGTELVIHGPADVPDDAPGVS